MKSYRGTTLVELILYITLVAGIVGTLSLYLSSVSSVANKSDTINEVNSNANQVFYILDKEIREAKTITLPNTSSRVSPTLSITRQDDSVVLIQITSNSIQITEGSTTTPITNNQVNVDNLEFKYLNPNLDSSSIAYEFTISRKNNTNRNEFSYTNTFYGTSNNE